jgi:hypothetical protein
MFKPLLLCGNYTYSLQISECGAVNGLLLGMYGNLGDEKLRKIKHFSIAVFLKRETRATIVLNVSPRLNIAPRRLHKTMNIGSYESKKRFCQCLAESHIPGNLGSQHWLTLEPSLIEQIQNLPFWEKCLLTQHYRTQIVCAFAQTLKDPMVKEAVMLQGEEQQRLVMTLQSFLKTYSIPSPPLSAVTIPKNLESAFIKVGYQNALDFFWMDGLRAAAHQAKFIPDELDKHLSLLFAEQTRHTVFLVNWMAYQKVKLKKRWGEWRAGPALWNRSGMFVRLMAAFGTKDVDERPDAMRWMMRFSPEMFLSLCLLTQKKRMQTFDANLLQPQLSVNVATFAREIFKVWPKRRVGSTL